MANDNTFPNHALVFGASGINGWAITNQLLNDYPSSNSFARVTTITNRPITRNFLWPKSDKLNMLTGVDLLTESGQEGLNEQLKRDLPDIHTVTHVFFCAYMFHPSNEVSLNLLLLTRAITAIDHLSPNFQALVLITGTRSYGTHLGRAYFPHPPSSLPLNESLPPLPEPFASHLFYYAQTSFLHSFSAGKSWTWTELRPDVVVGFVPNDNAFNLAQAIAMYLACCREVEGEGAECSFPGTKASWVAKNNDSGQDGNARLAVFASLNAELCGGGRAINVADSETPSSWSEKWPGVCEYFGLKGVSPVEENGEDGKLKSPGQYLLDNAEVWKRMERDYGLVGNGAYNDRGAAEYAWMALTLLDFDHNVDLSRMKQAFIDGGQGFEDEKDVKKVWYTAFDRFRKARIIP